MVFSSTSDKSGLIQDIEMNIFGNYGDISGNADLLYNFTARLNRSYDKLATILMSVDGRWQFDDTNYTDLPIGSTSLVANQQDYSFDVEYLDVEKVTALDTSGNVIILHPFDITDPLGRAYLNDTTGGTPTHYDKVGGTIMLYPKPNYAKTSGLTVHYRRKPSYFAYTDTTKAPGVPAIYHRFLSLDASLDYAISKQLTAKNDLAVKVKEMEDRITETHSKRSKDESKHIYGIFRSSR